VTKTKERRSKIRKGKKARRKETEKERK